MADFGFWELAVIMLVGLLFVGPDRLPHVAKTIGKWTGTIRRLAADFRNELSHEIDRNELKKTIGRPTEELRSLRGELDQITREVNHNLRNLDPVAKSIEEQIDEGRFVSAEMADSPTTGSATNNLDTPHGTEKKSSDKDKKTVGRR